MGYRIIETTADIGIESWGRSFVELCRGFLDGFYAIAFTEPAAASGQGARLDIEGATEADTAFALIEEAVFRLYTKAEMLRVEDIRGTAVIVETVPAPRQEIAVEIKAATRHRFTVAPTPDNHWKGTCILDI